MIKNQRLLAFLVACLCLIAVLLTGYYYISSIRTDMMDQAIENVQMVTKQQEQAFSNFVEQDQERVHSFAVYFTSCSSTDEDRIRDRMRAFGEIEAIYTVVNLSTGEYCNNRSFRIYRMGQESWDTYRGLAGSSVRESYIGLYDDTPMFGYYETFRFSDGVAGLFHKGYEKAKVSSEFSLNFYDGQGFAFVVTREGDILLRSVGSEENYSAGNILDHIGSTEVNKEDKKAFMEALASHETGVKIFHNNGVDYVYTYVPVSAVEDWYLVSIVPLATIMDEADEIIDNSYVVFFIIFMILSIFAAAFCFVWRYHRNIEKKDREISYKEQQFSLLSSFLSQNTDDVYIMMDKKNFQVEFVSPNIERVLGFHPQEVMKNIRVLGRASYKSKERIEFEELTEMSLGSTIGPMEAERPNPITGEEKWYRETLYDVQIQDQEKIIAYISDRTAEQQIQDTLTETLESAQTANKAKSTFLSSMSHDIRTPMNAIMGLITLIQEDVKDPERVMEYTQRMSSASNHLLELINNVLDMNKIESGSVTLTIGELNLPELIDRINMIIRPQAKAKGQDFRLWASALSSEHLLGDSTRISQILINLLSNAVKYTQEGGRIEFTVQELPQVLNNYSRIQFVVRDNGQGMSKEYQKVMFDPFTREQTTFTNKIQGTGLGMAITKSLVDLMGGKIQVDSQQGKGTTFVVELELRIQKKDLEENFWKEHAIARMIVADDDPITRESVIRSMEETGVTVHHAEDGEEAVRMIREGRERGEPYDLILLDWRMPKLDGLETARLLRKNYPHKIPILFFTAYDWSEIEEEARDIGVSHFLPKPFFMATFQDAIRKIRRESRLQNGAQDKKDSVLEGKHILVAEDIEVNRLILGKILATYKATCDMAENGQVAVEKFSASQPGRYDMIFMDVQMPVMNGYEATKAIRSSMHPDAKTVPIIAMTANAFADDVREALEAGMDAHVSKPIVMDQLENTLRKILEAKGIMQ